MIPVNEVLDLIEKLDDKKKTFAEFLAVLLKDKFIEIYLGDSYEEVSLDQISTAYPAVFFGKVVGAYRECLIINSVYVEDKKVKLGNLMFINERSIRALNEVDGRGIMEDMFLRSRETVEVKNVLMNRIKKNADKG